MVKMLIADLYLLTDTRYAPNTRHESSATQRLRGAIFAAMLRIILIRISRADETRVLDLLRRPLYGDSNHDMRS